MKTIQRRREIKARAGRLVVGDFRPSDHAGTNARPVTLVGKLTGFSEQGEPLVDYPGRSNSPSLGALARTTVPLDKSQINCEVVLLFAGPDASEPIIIGCILPPAAPQTTSTGESPVLDAQLNGKRLELTAEEELVLRCGHASITLTRAGKVLIRGAYLLSRSSGVNRIKGGSVQIN